MKDCLVKATALDERVRIYCASTTNLVEDTRKQHDLWPTSCAALGRIESMAVIMGGMLKNKEEKITISINGGGAIGTCLVQVNGNGEVKGFCGDNQIYLKYNDTNKLAVGLAVGTQGYLSVTKDLGLKENFTGKVAIQTGELGDDFAYYYAVSEQIPSVVSLGVLVNVDYSCKAAGSLLIQMMPDATEEDIEKVEQVTKNMKPISKYMDEGYSPEQVIKALFEDAQILETSDFKWHCDCSKDRFKAALSTLHANEIQEMIDEDHGCEVKCEYCNKTYHFNEEELKGILDFKGHVQNR